MPVILDGPQAYIIGVLGSVTVEVAAVCKECAELNGKWPERYKSYVYPALRFVLALCAGSLPAVMDAPNMLTAFYLGASAPLLIDRLSRGVKLGGGEP